MTNNLGTREEWANKVVEAYRPIFDKAGVWLPDRIRVGFGFTSKGARVSPKTKEIVAKTEALHAGRSGDDTMEIIVSISEGDPMNVGRLIVRAMLEGSILSNETAKSPDKAAALKLTAALRKDVRVSADKIGFDSRSPLDGKMDFPFSADGAERHRKIIEEQLGGFDHAAVVLAMPKKPKAKAGATRQLKVYCPHVAKGAGVDKKTGEKIDTPCVFKVRASTAIVEAAGDSWKCPIHGVKLIVDEGSKAKAGVGKGRKGQARVGNKSAAADSPKATARIAKRAGKPRSAKGGKAESMSAAA